MRSVIAEGSNVRRTVVIVDEGGNSATWGNEFNIKSDC